MTKLTQKAVAAIVAIVGISAASQSAQAAPYRHIDRMAVQLERQAKQLSREFRLRYAYVADYRHLMSDAAEVRRVANHLHEAANRGRVPHMSTDLRKLDKSFRHLQRLVNKLNHNATHDPYGVVGHIDGNTTDVRQMMRRMKKSLRHLRKEINETLRPPVHGQDDFGFDGGYYTPRYRSPRHGFSYRNDRFSIRIGH